jgi:predicted amidophosphoribosyltransferase
VPLPLSKERLRQRGFNQAAEIARPVPRGIVNQRASSSTPLHANIRRPPRSRSAATLRTRLSPPRWTD